MVLYAIHVKIGNGLAQCSDKFSRSASVGI